MATQTSFKLVDDLDGTEAAHSLQFQLDGHQFEIDLSDDHAAHLRDVFAPYVAAARRSGRNGRTTARPQPARRDADGSRSRTELPAIREWARTHGHQVSDRGRLPGDVVNAYEHRDDTPAPAAVPPAPEPAAEAAPPAAAEAKPKRRSRKAAPKKAADQD